MGKEVETQPWPDVKSLMSSVRSLDLVPRALGSMEDSKQGTDMCVVCIFKRSLGQQGPGKGQESLSGHCSKKGGTMKMT